ncbi:hypothetical protein LJY25_12975 [Hymenobacter sp. BT175]|uniref:hypothetical protein n=1 Tax=Hymenobacter translucens TaxID=2886507 RepID=UPI001D0EEBFC|nr:hypothetical protein [Hymenobacter translucens]MCC2547361.1 hypothetical protein [Hymenobacter translucens]
MKHSLLLLSCAALLAAGASCSKDKNQQGDSDTAVVIDNDALATDTTDAALRAEASRMAQQTADNMHLTDTVVVTRVEEVYYQRGRRLRQVRQQYTTDTTGRYAAIRSVNSETDAELSTVLRGDGDADATTTTVTTTTSSGSAGGGTASRRRGPRIVKSTTEPDGDRKIEYSDGTKVKIEADGDYKVKRADDTKIKVEDGERKVKR